MEYGGKCRIHTAAAQQMVRVELRSLKIDRKLAGSDCARKQQQQCLIGMITGTVACLREPLSDTQHNFDADVIRCMWIVEVRSIFLYFYENF